MGISRDSRHKRRLTGGRRAIHQKKRKFELGRPPANTKLGGKRIHVVRSRGGNLKFRALRLETGNFSWGSESSTRKTRVLDVVYNASNNELVRTKTLVKNAVVQIDATPFRQWYEHKYGVVLGKKKAHKDGDEEKDSKEPAVAGKTLKKAQAKRAADAILEPNLRDAFLSGRLLACVSSRPGQSGRCDGYILEQKELEFYVKKLKKK